MMSNETGSACQKSHIVWRASWNKNKIRFKKRHKRDCAQVNKSLYRRKYRNVMRCVVGEEWGCGVDRKLTSDL